MLQSGMSSSAREFFAREFDFFGQITGVSGKIRQFELGPARKVCSMAREVAPVTWLSQTACLEELAKIVLRPGCYLPSNPDAVVTQIDYTSGAPMQSHAKAPYLATFTVQRCRLADLADVPERDVEEKLAQLGKLGPKRMY